MQFFSTDAILLKKTAYGSSDLIITFMTRERGKISAVAKGGQKSVKRFSGVLDLFTMSEIILRYGKGKLPYLEEASLAHAFSSIRLDILKTAFASYWGELILKWLEEKKKQPEIYNLLWRALDILDKNKLEPEPANILFQIKLIRLSGFSPNLNFCALCKTKTFAKDKIAFDLKKGGLICQKCLSGTANIEWLSKGTIKELLWLDKTDMNCGCRILFSSGSLKEAGKFTEAFVQYHIKDNIKSLGFIKKIKKRGRF